MINKNSLILLSIIAIQVFTFQLQEQNLIQSLSTLGEVAPSGDNYPKQLPKATKNTSLSQKQVLFLLGNGVEDHEVYYQHQYFVDRGVSKVTFACPQSEIIRNGKVVISDFFKPSYTLDCVPAESLNLQQFDIVFVAGGLPSSSALRKSKPLMDQIYQYWKNPSKQDNLLAIICSGSEVLISSGIYKELPDSQQIVTGSPASTQSWNAHLEQLGRPKELFKGNDDKFKSIKILGNGKHTNIVLGRNPDASPDFVQQIGEVLGLQDSANEKVNLNLQNGVYVHAQFTPLNDKQDLNALYPFPRHNLSAKNLRQLKLSNKKVALVSASGSNYDDVGPLINVLRNQLNVQVDVLCPSWIITYKNADIFLHTNPPSSVVGKIKCTVPFDQAKNNQYDAFIVPGGLFSTNGVLRNDGDLNELLKHQKLVLLIGSALDLLYPSQILQKNSEVPFVDVIANDLENAGYKINNEKHIISYDNLALSDGRIIDYALEFISQRLAQQQQY